MPATRERIVAAGLRLFAERGYHGTSVGDIESAAGLSPRSGALYKHFPSKAAVLEAAMEQRTRSFDQADVVLGLVPIGDLRTELTIMARFILEEVGAQQQIVRVTMKEGDRFPELREEFHERLVNAGWERALRWWRTRCQHHGVPEGDGEARMVALFGSLILHPVMGTLFAQEPAGVDEDRLVAAWLEGALGQLEAWGISQEPIQEEATT
ncbi:MAG: TetR/AcrR family transcriptional regulator [Actinomycetota bacterium]|nr:TetR/AcrR family transcriptional regulator [Actinomycetota bacterium]